MTARLMDHLLAVGCGYPAGSPHHQVDREILLSMARCPMLVIDNVSQFFYEQDERDDWDISKDFPNIAPPFARFWMECKAPTRINRRGTVTLEGHDLKEHGWFFQARRLDDGWAVQALLFARGWAPLPGVLGTLALGVDKNGSYSDEILQREFAHAVPGFKPGDLIGGAYGALAEMGQDFVNMLNHSIQPFLLALSLLHCKNIARSEVNPPKPMSRKWERIYGKPLLRYHVLDIDPMRKILRSEGGQAQNGIRRALHICRGHFARYTEDAPLFGRVTGSFWKPQHVRGSSDRGVVLKDYNVHAAPEAGQ